MGKKALGLKVSELVAALEGVNDKSITIDFWVKKADGTVLYGTEPRSIKSNGAGHFELRSVIDEITDQPGHGKVTVQQLLDHLIKSKLKHKLIDVRIGGLAGNYSHCTEATVTVTATTVAIGGKASVTPVYWCPSQDPASPHFDPKKAYTS